MAAAGCAGAPDALEGKAGFFTAFMGDLAQASDVGKDLGTVWRGLDVTYSIAKSIVKVVAPPCRAKALSLSVRLS